MKAEYMSKKIRTLAICIFYHQGRILAAKGYDKLKDEFFYRPYGGGIEFGEKAEEAVKREVLEETGYGMHDITLIGVTENIFTFNGKQGHEIVFLFDAKFDDIGVYDLEVVQGVEDSKGLELEGHWCCVSQIVSGDVVVYPDGIAEAIQAYVMKQS